MKLAYRIFPFLHWQNPTFKSMQRDCVAGMSVAFILIPQSVAYANLAGMPLVTGIYAALWPLLLATLFGASPRLGVGASALTCLLVSAALSGVAEPGSERWVNSVVWLAIGVGGLQILLGCMRFGWLFNLVNATVLMAFTQAAVLLIIYAQLPHVLGVSALSMRFFEGAFDHEAFAFGLISIVVLYTAKKFKPVFPNVLVILLASAGVSWYLGFAAKGGMVIGELPAGLPSLYIPQWLGLSEFGRLAMPILVIGLISFLETAVSAKEEHRQARTQWNENQDLIGQGIAKIASGLSGSFATSTSFSRSAINLMAGAQTGWANIFAVWVVLMVLLFLLPLLYHVPHAVLGAVVIVAVMGLLRPKAIVRLFRISAIEASIAVITFGTTLLSAPRIYWGVLIGIMLSLCHFLYQRLHPRIIEVGLHADGRLRDRHLWKLPVLASRTYALRMDAELDFGSAHALEKNINEYLIKHPDTERVIIIAQPINHIDVTGVETFARIYQSLLNQDRSLIVVGLKLPAERVLQRAGLFESSPSLQWFVTEQALFDYLKTQ